MRWVQYAGVLLDRLFKMNMLNYARARIRNTAVMDFHHFPSKFGPMFFVQGEAANKEVPNENFHKTVKTIEGYDYVLKKKGIRFIFLPIPNKENIYHEYLPNSRRPIFLEQLIQELKSRNIETVDTQRAFEDEYQNHSTLLYFLDDSHWNPKGVHLAADFTIKLIKRDKR
jgi:hypothetical protein